MRLDVVIPTHNRADLLPLALESLLRAERPADLEVDVTVVDNRSTDGTRALVESFGPRFSNLHYVYESKPGRSHALNAGIAATRGDLVAMIDDDEEVDSKWLVTIASAFRDASVDFIGGPYLPRWGGDPPPWLLPQYGSVVGWVESSPTIQRFGPGFDGMLMGGNAVIRRSLLERVGPYATDLGRTPGGRLLSCEDDDMFARLLAVGARGFYRPDLIIHHYVPPERLTKRYFRRWCFWRGVSRGVIDKRRPEPVRYLLGVPRYMVGAVVRGALEVIRPRSGTRSPSRTFQSELACWDLAGFAYGKHGYPIEQRLRSLLGRSEGLPAHPVASHGPGGAPIASEKTP